MNILKLSPEYQCSPIWEYTPDGEIIDNDIPEPLRNDKELDDLIGRIENIWDSGYVDTPTEFYGKPWPTEEDRLAFVHLFKDTENLLRSRYGDKYVIINNVTIDSFKNEEGTPC